MILNVNFNRELIFIKRTPAFKVYLTLSREWVLTAGLTVLLTHVKSNIIQTTSGISFPNRILLRNAIYNAFIKLQCQIGLCKRISEKKTFHTRTHTYGHKYARTDRHICARTHLTHSPRHLPT